MIDFFRCDDNIGCNDEAKVIVEKTSSIFACTRGYDDIVLPGAALVRDSKLCR